ncbi:MAG: glycoside hydrolase family 78 protein [Anaerolineaceae bacterium]
MTTSLQIRNLRCEYSIDPLGIDILCPRLSWVLESTQRAQKQTAYRCLAAGSLELLEEGKADLWDSGKVDSSQSIQVEYVGKPSKSRQQVWWKVCVWDKDGAVSDFSQPARWEMGLLNPTDWSARWIGAGLVGGPRTTIPAPFFRKIVSIQGNIRSARLYVTALGLYEMEINGQKVGEDLLTPGWTNYRKRVQYQTYDVTGLLNSGENVVGSILGDGWYCGHVAWWDRQGYGDRPKLLAQLEIVFENGNRKTVATDSTWEYAFGPILEADLLMGESYDARLAAKNWSCPGFGGWKWMPVELFEDPGIQLVAQVGPTVRRIKELKPIAPARQLSNAPSPDWIFDMGQNMVGRVRLKVKGPAGTTIRLRFAEMLDSEGKLYTVNLRSARQTDYYTLRGDGEEIYEPRFTFHGFRYVEVHGYPGDPQEDTITGVVIHSATPPSGSFECSDALINQLQHNIQWGQKGNFVDIPTDCPQRDERLGWTGDAQVFIRTATFNMDVSGFFTRWLQVLEDSQSTNGAYPPFAPYPSLEDADGGPAWADAGIICPWTIYQVYGDKRILEQHYDSMVRFIEYLQRTSQDLIRVYEGYPGFSGYGDWLSINAETPKDLIGTAFFAYSAGLLSKIAGILGKQNDCERFAQLHDSVKRAFQERYVTDAGLVAGHTQTAYVLALYFDLLPEALRQPASNALVNNIGQRKMHLSTGFAGAPYLNHTLTRSGRLEVGYELLNQKSWPSWLYPVTQGATTIWERWDGWTDDKGFQDPVMNSFNHYAYGSIGDWLYAVVAGIDIDPDHPGFQHFILRPCPGGGLTFTKAEYNAITGKIACEWRLGQGIFHLSVTIPANTSARVYIPTQKKDAVHKAGNLEGVTFLGMEGDRAIFEVLSGTYGFESQIR